MVPAKKRLYRDHLRKYFAFVDAERWEPMLELFHADVVYHRSGHPPITGIDALRDFYATDRLIATGRHSIEALIVDGEWAVAKGVFRGLLKDGTDVTVEFADFHRFRDDRIWRRYTYFAGRPV